MDKLTFIATISTIIGGVSVIVTIIIKVFNFIKNNANKIVDIEQVSSHFFNHINNYNSKFANSSKELEDVLKLRRTCFGSNIIVPDEIYKKCYYINSDSFRLVTAKGKPVGYWGVIPVSLKTYNLFLKGNLAHETILTNEVQKWETFKNKKVYLYVIGIVVPNKVRLKSAYVIMDMVNFAMELFKRKIKINGICCYTVKDEGFNLVKDFGFKTNGKFINNDHSQPVSLIPKKDLHHLYELLQIKAKRYVDYTPKWDEDDKKRFFNFLE